MVFSSKKDSFFLVLENSSDSTPIVLRPEGDSPATRPPSRSPEQTASAAAGSVLAAPTALEVKDVVSATTPETSGTATNATTASSVLTTAEAIAAELAAADAARPAVSLTTFAPENLLPGQTLAQRRRRPGASIKSFSTMAAELFKS